ncbi:MAG: twin-arginine translocase TatA/TatE family subunit [Flavobacteriales bacterium]|nr:twin-arginine translocase TatA/TatE family subunit [Flavobacteriales bacterium]MCB9335157.1 twin-arginine translocase TatA/TatE family subunit [Flavobacteriales bacterium]
MLSQTLLLFNIGGAELFFIVLVIIMFFGSKKIPELARGLGKGLREIKNATGEIQQEIKKSADVTGLKKNLDVKAQVNKIIDDAVKEPESKAETKEVEKEQESEPEQQGQPNTVSRSSTSYTTNQEEK